MAGKDVVDVPVSKVKAELLRILKAEGFIMDYSQVDDRTLRIKMKYAENGERVITKIQRVSKPGCRVYCGKDDLPKVLNGLGIAIVSTSKGLLTEREARLNNVGGEVLCTVW
jgi:small subunit ribosomal protein S8